nr:UDP binding domain-containing protein [Desulfitibacter alkalitolerans]
MRKLVAISVKLPREWALISALERSFFNFKIIKETLSVNYYQKRKPLEILQQSFTSLSGVKVAILGLAFKPGTDDVREAPALDIIRELAKQGAVIQAYDPIAVENLIQ